MPQITIAPKAICEISTVVTIDIQPNDNVRLERQQNNLKLIHCVHTPTIEDFRSEIANNEDCFPLKIPVKEIRKKSTAVQDGVAGFLDGNNQHQTTSSLRINKYLTPFLSDSHEQRQSTLKTFEEDILHNETSSSLVESVSINLSSSSILSESFALDTLQRGHVTEIRNPVERILNDIFENEQQTSMQGTDTQEADVQSTISTDALQLRDLLEKIRSDKTSLELAIERRNTMGYVCSADKLASPIVHQSGEDHIKIPTMQVSNPQKSKEDTIDKSVQCDDLDETTRKVESVERADSRMPRRKMKIRPKLKRELNEDVIRSPKFAKTLNSIRLSARKLNYDSENGKYKTATPEQIQKAAEKFLNSLIKDENLMQPIRRDVESDSDSLNSYILVPPKYRVIDDKIIQSQYNNMMPDTSGLTSDSTIDPILPNRIIMSSDEINASTSSNSIDLRLSNLSLRYNAHNEQPLGFGNCDSNGNMSDGEVLSEGEIRPDEGNIF